MSPSATGPPRSSASGSPTPLSIVPFIYFSNGSKGTDVIRAVTSRGNTCTASAVWSDIVNECPVAFCKYGTFAAGPGCATSVPAEELNAGAFDVILREVPPAPYDFTISKLKAPKSVKFTALTPTITLPATVTIVNVSTNTETITSLDGLATLVVQSLGAECANPTVVMRPLATSPVILAPRKKLNVYFDITFDCVRDRSGASAIKITGSWRPWIARHSVVAATPISPTTIARVLRIS
jgi:hypothetical protein